jgi:hypothetical protein
VSSLLEQKAVVLRLEAGSTDAGFLSAFCPVSNTPTFVVIQYVPRCRAQTKDTDTHAEMASFANSSPVGLRKRTSSTGYERC